MKIHLNTGPTFRLRDEVHDQGFHPVIDAFGQADLWHYAFFLLKILSQYKKYQTPHQDPETNRDHCSPAPVDVKGDRDQAEQRDVFQNDVRHMRDRFRTEIES